MPVFKVTRTKRYIAEVEAKTPELALLRAADVPGNMWRVLDDSIDGDVYGLDGARQQMGPPRKTPNLEKKS